MILRLHFSLPRELFKLSRSKASALTENIPEYLNSDPRHEWVTKGFDPKKVQAMKDYYKERYNQNVE